MEKDYSRKLLVTLLLCVASVLVTHAQEVYTVDGLKYVILDEESVELRGSVEAIEGDLVVPSKVLIEDTEYKVTSVGEKAFQTNRIVNLTIPASIVTIKRYAFNTCRDLVSLFFEESDEPLTIDEGNHDSFESTPNLEYVFLGRVLLQTYEKLRYGILSHKDHLRSVHIGPKVRILDDSLFEYCSSLTDVVIDEGLQLIGKGAFAYTSSLNAIHLPQSLTYLGDYVFYKSGLQQINIPSKLQHIGNETFSISENLETVTFSEGIDSIAKKAFYACTSLKHINFPNSLNYLGASAFEGCRSLTSVHAGKNLRVIEEKAFYNCSSLADLLLSEAMDAIGKSAFAGCASLNSFEFPKGIKEVHSNTLDFCHGIKKLTYNQEIEKIDALGFYGYSHLIQLDTIIVQFTHPIDYSRNNQVNLIVKVPHGCGCDFRKAKNWSSHLIMEEDEEVVWAHVSEPGTLYAEINKQIQPAYVGKLKVTGQLNENDWKVLQRDKTGFLYSIDLSEVTNTTIPASQFNGKSWLTDIRLPQDLEIISYNAFYGCSRLTGRLELPKSFKTFGQSSMSKTNFSEIVLNSEVSVERDAFQYCNSLKSITSDSIISLGSSVFYSCPALEKFTSSEKLTIINNFTFCGCSGLKEVILSEGITKIGDYAFSGCSSLKAVLIPSSTKSIGALAFSSCISLQDVYAFSEVPCSCSADAFQSITQEATLHVPDGTEGDYFVARGWEKFMHIVSFDPSSVDDRTVDDQHVPAGIYDLNGRKVDSPLKGHLYIVNGQKVFIR